jgi:cytochrome c biogenesis protein CcdA
MLARRYWAVLGFEVILGLQIVVFSLALTRVQKWWLAIALTIAIGLLGWLFWKLIRAMARLQMTDRGSAQATR